MYTEAFKEAQKVVRECGAYLRYKQYEQLEYKSGINDLVTDMDRKCELYLKRKLATLIENVSFVGEEGSKTISDRMWIIDPIDGTTNFICSHENFAISVAFYENKQPIFGIVYDVMKDEMFSAYTNKGAWLNQKQLESLKNKSLEECVWDASLNSILEISEYYQTSLSAISSRTRGHRSLGCASLAIAHIAQGKLDLYFSAHLKVWDYAAAIIILSECGGSAYIEKDFFTEKKTVATFAVSKQLLEKIKKEYFH